MWASLPLSHFNPRPLLLFLFAILTTIHSASFFTTQPFDGHILRFFGTVNCTSAGEPDCSDSLGIMHIVQHGGAKEEFKFTNLNVTIIDAFNQTQPYSRWNTTSYIKEGTATSISAQFPLHLAPVTPPPDNQVSTTPPRLPPTRSTAPIASSPDTYPIGLFFGQVELHWSDDLDKPLPFTDPVYSDETSLYYANSTFSVQLGDLEIDAVDVYRNLHTTHPLLNPDLSDQEWTLNMTMFGWEYNNDGFRTASPNFVITLPRHPPKLPSTPSNFDDLTINSAQPSSHSKTNDQQENDGDDIETITSFKIDLVGPIQFWSSRPGRISNIPCIIRTFAIDPSKRIEIDEFDKSDDFSLNSGLTRWDNDTVLTHTYNWHGDPVLPLGWPKTRTFSGQGDDDAQPEFYTSFELSPMSATPDPIEVDKYTTKIDIQCSTVGYLEIRSLFPFHKHRSANPDALDKLSKGDVPIIESIPTFASISFNTTNSKNTEPYMMALTHPSPLFIQPDPTDGVLPPDAPVSPLIIIIMSCLAAVLLIGILIMFKVQYKISIPCCPGSSACRNRCGGRDARIKAMLVDYQPYNKNHPAYGLSYDQYREKVLFYEYGHADQLPTIDQQGDDPRHFELGNNDGLTSRNTDLAGLMSDFSELPDTASNGIALNGRVQGRDRDCYFPQTKTTGIPATSLKHHPTQHVGMNSGNHPISNSNNNNNNNNSNNNSRQDGQGKSPSSPQAPRRQNSQQSVLFISESYAKKTGQYTPLTQSTTQQQSQQQQQQQQQFHQQQQQRYNSSVGLPSSQRQSKSGGPMTGSQSGYGSFQ